MRLRILLCLFALLPTAVFAQAPQTDEEKTLYAVGLVMQRSLKQFDLSAAELEIIRRALADAQAGKPAVDLDEWGPKIQALVKDPTIATEVQNDIDAGNMVPVQQTPTMVIIAKGKKQPWAMWNSYPLLKSYLDSLLAGK